MVRPVSFKSCQSIKEMEVMRIILETKLVDSVLSILTKHKLLFLSIVKTIVKYWLLLTAIIYLKQRVK
jgi:hypothetical protein